MIKRFIHGLIALCLLALPLQSTEKFSLIAELTSPATPIKVEQQAWFTGGGQLQGFWVSGAVAANPVLAFQACTVDTANASTYNFTSIAVGATGTAIIGVGSRDGTANFTISSVTVDSVSASNVISEDAATANSLAGLWIVTGLPDGTANVDVVFSETTNNAVICVSSVANINSTTAVATATGENTDGSAITLDANVSALGVAVGMSTLVGDALDTAWTNLTERADATLDTGVSNVSSYSMADYTNVTSAETPRTMSCDGSGTQGASCVLATFR